MASTEFLSMSVIVLYFSNGINNQDSLFSPKLYATLPSTFQSRELLN